FVVDQLAAQRVRSGGAIINFSTSVTRLQIPTYGAYAASKGAVESLTLILARELRGRDITVNAVAPGPTATPLFFEGKTQEAIDQIAAANPMERMGTPADVAETVALDRKSTRLNSSHVKSSYAVLSLNKAATLKPIATIK